MSAVASPRSKSWINRIKSKPSGNTSNRSKSVVVGSPKKSLAKTTSTASTTSTTAALAETPKKAATEAAKDAKVTIVDAKETATEQAKDAAQKHNPKRLPSKLPSQLKRTSSILTRTRGFQKLSNWAFAVIDKNNTGLINQEELYAGILLVHVEFAKYVGAAACYPPSRHVVDSLFSVFDVNDTKHINKDEFFEILKICSVDIASRIFVYFVILILWVPYLSRGFVKYFLQMDEYFEWHLTDRHVTAFDWIERILTWNEVAKQTVGLALLYLMIPIFFSWIDHNSTEKALKLADKYSSRKMNSALLGGSLDDDSSDDNDNNNKDKDDDKDKDMTEKKKKSE